MELLRRPNGEKSSSMGMERFIAAYFYELDEYCFVNGTGKLIRNLKKRKLILLCKYFVLIKVLSQYLQRDLYFSKLER